MERTIEDWAEIADDSGKILEEACNGLATGILEAMERAEVPREIWRQVYSKINDSYIIDKD
jgi:hypothetical protein